MLSTIKTFIPFAIVITALCGLLYIVEQQNLRQGANDPQIQIVEDSTSVLQNGADVAAVVPSQKINIGESLSPFVLVYNTNFQLVAGNAVLGLDKHIPVLPTGVLQSTNEPSEYGDHRITWQPEPGVRLAIVVQKYNKGYVVVGRSLREVEYQEDKLLLLIGAGWIVTMLFTFVASLLFTEKQKKK
jgi:hypothetical protein